MVNTVLHACVTCNFRSVRHLVFEDVGHGNTENISPQMMAQLKASANKQPGLRQQNRGLQFQQPELVIQEEVFREPQFGVESQLAAERSQGMLGTRQNQSLNNSVRTPSSFIIPNSHPSSGESFDKVSKAG